MKNKFLFIIFICGSLYSQAISNEKLDLQNFLSDEISNMHEYKNNLLLEKINFEELNQYKNKWIPNFYVYSGMSYLYNSLYDEKYIHNLDFISKICFTQKLPLGISLDTQMFSISGNLYEENIFYNFEYLGNIDLQIPVFSYLFGFATDYSFIDKFEKENFVNYVNSISKLNYIKLQNYLLLNLIKFSYYKELYNFYCDKQIYLSDYQNDCKQLFELGQISFSDFINIKQSVYENNILLNQTKFDFSEFENILLLSGITLTTFDFSLDDVISYCKENFENFKYEFTDLDFEFYQLQKDWINFSKEYLKSFPSLVINFQTLPNSTTKNYFAKYDNFLESFSYYWNSIDSCDLKLSLSLKFSLNEYDEVYTNKKNFEMKKIMYKNNLIQLSQQRIQENKNRQEKVTLLKNNYINSYQKYLQEKEFLLSYKQMQEKNYISKYEYDNFNFYIQQLYFDYVKNFINYLEYLLSVF